MEAFAIADDLDVRKDAGDQASDSMKNPRRYGGRRQTVIPDRVSLRTAGDTRYPAPPASFPSPLPS